MADPEPTSDISNNPIAAGGGGSNGGRPEPLGDLSKPPPNRLLQGVQIDSASDSPQTLTPPCDLPTVVGSPLQLLPPNLLPLNGNPTKNRRSERDRKIVLYILAPDNGHRAEKAVLQSVYDDLRQSYACRGFELQLADVHDRGGGGEGEDAAANINYVDARQWVADGPLESRGGHHLATTCLSEISSKCYYFGSFQTNHILILIALFASIQDIQI